MNYNDRDRNVGHHRVYFYFEEFPYLYFISLFLIVFRVLLVKLRTMN